LLHVKERYLAVARIVAAAAVIASLAGPASGRQSAPMAYRWEAGKASRLKLVANLSGALPILGNVEPVELDAVLTIVYRATPLGPIKAEVAAPAGAAPSGPPPTRVEFRVETAEAEVAGIPLSVPMEDARKVLDRTVTFARSGEVVRVEGGSPLPFALTIPGVDPQRLYTLLCPVVFPAHPVAVGDSWDFRSELLGSEGAPARFKGAVLAPAAGSIAPPKELRVGEEFTMDVDQRLDKDKKPVEAGVEAHRSRTGAIKGAGVMVFEPSAGRLLRGHLTIQAQITEKVLGEPAPDEPAETVSRVKAVVRITSTPATASRGKAERRPSGRKPL